MFIIVTIKPTFHQPFKVGTYRKYILYTVRPISNNKSQNWLKYIYMVKTLYARNIGSVARGGVTNFLVKLFYYD